MLIKNEISFEGNNGLQNYGVLLMIISYMLSLFGLILIGIILLKLIIVCFFTDKYNHLFCVRSDKNHIKPGLNHRNSVSDISVISNESSTDSGFSKLKNILLKISETQISAKQHCICPICANEHLNTTPTTRSVMDNLNTTLKKGETKRSSFILRSAQVLSKKLILKKENKFQNESNNKEDGHKNHRIIPIVSQTETQKITFKKIDKQMGEVKQIGNYGDVVLELKQKFSSMTMINTIA